MSEKRVLTVKCPCGAMLQVKTRSAEKLVACPKCRATMTIVAAPTAAPQPSLPMAQPLAQAALPFAQPMPAPRRWSAKYLGLAGGVVGSALTVAVLVLALRSGTGSPSQTSPGTGGAAAQPGANPNEVEVTELADETPANNEQAAVGPGEGEQGGNFFDALSKAQTVQGANNPGIQGGGFPQGGFPSAGNTQQRDWNLANGGRLGAMGLKKVQVRPR